MKECWHIWEVTVIELRIIKKCIFCNSYFKFDYTKQGAFPEHVRRYLDYEKDCYEI